MMAFKTFAQRHPVSTYSVLACAITWALVFPLVASSQGWIDATLSPNWHALGALGPISAAFIVAHVVGGGRAAKELLGGMRRWRVGIVWFSLAALSPFVLFATAIIILRVAGNPWPDLGALASDRYANLAWIGGVIVSSVAYGVGEETGWRGFALPRLQSGRGALSATFVLTALWALWHVPFFFYRLEFGAVQVVGFFVGLLAGAVWLTCLYNSTGGSVLMAILWHTAWNLVSLIAAVVSVAALSLMSVTIMVAAVAIVLGWGPSTLSPRRKAISSASEGLSEVETRL